MSDKVSVPLEALHIPTVAHRGTGWGVFCYACSHYRQDYTYPCLIEHAGTDQSYWPAGLLVEAD